MPPSSPVESDGPDLSTVYEAVIQATEALKYWKAQREAALEQLAELVAEGEADAQTIWNDYSISQQRKVTYEFPADHPIHAQEKALKNARNLAIALGEAEKKETVYFTVKAV